MRKRIGALGLAAALLLAMLCPALAADGTAEFVVNGPEGAVKAGESFTVTVELKNNPGFNAIEFTLTYDRDKLTCEDAVEGELLSKSLSVTNPDADTGAIVAAASTRTITGDGAVGEFTFTAGEDLAAPAFGLTHMRLNDAEGKEIGCRSDSEVPEPVDPTPSGGNDTPGGNDTSGGNDTPGGSDTPGGTTPSGGGDTPGGTPQTDPGKPETPARPADPATPDPGQTQAPETGQASFTDTKGHWGEAFIEQAAALGLFNGFPDGSFGPNLKVTRGQFITVLYRMAGSPAVTGETPFTDIANQSQEFQNAITWGYQQGYINGKSPDAFDPGGSITRQEAMKILFAYAGGQPGAETMFTAIYDDEFADSGEIAAWAKNAMYWGYYNGILNGKTANTLCPRDTATRAELAKILVIFSEKFPGK